jgi:hypothetical protein
LSLGEEEKLMRKLKVSKIWISAFLLAVLVAGCGDSDKNAGATGGPLTPPTVLAASVTPTAGSTILCPNIAVITATFNKAMNPATINTSTFTLTGPGGSVTGIVSYVAATQIATFAQATPPGLAVGATYTATITTGAADTFGNMLAANFTWTFTTSGPCPGPPATITLGSACGFGILGATPSVTNTGGTVITGGTVGISPALSITGFPPGTAPGGPPFPDTGAGSLAGTAQNDLTTAYTAATPANLPGGVPIPADIGGLPKVFAPGVYTATSTLAITGDLTLDGSTNPGGTWVFQVGTALTTADGGAGTPASRVLLINGAQAGHVFWQVGSAATLGTNSVFVGNIMAQATITLKTGASLDGRALDRSAAVILDTNAVTVPTPCQ